jgi:hypothetical protein
MITHAHFRRDRIVKPGRFAITIRCADDLAADEMIMLVAWFETKVSLLQGKTRGYTDEQTLQWECEALGIDPATQGVA